MRPETAKGVYPVAKLTLAMIVRNGEQCLQECLASAAGIVDEIVIGDTGSTDGTVKIAEKCGARVLNIPWTDDFAAARNAVLGHATGDWILHLDADEMLDQDGARRIRDLVDADGAGADAVELTVANYSDEIRAWRWRPVAPGAPSSRGFSGFIPVGLLRLFRNGRGYHYREPVHENITESLVESGGVVRSEAIMIHHYGYAGSEERRRQKAHQYFEIACKKVEQRPRDPKAWHDLAELALFCGLTNEAEAACRETLQIAPGHIQGIMTLATLLLNRGGLDEAESLLIPMLGRPEAPAHAVAALGAIALRRGRLEYARELTLAALQRDPSSLVARLYLARILDCMMCAEDAAAELDAMLATAPGCTEVVNRRSAHSLRTSAEVLCQTGHPKDALVKLTQALQLDPEDPLIYKDIGAVLTILGLNEKADEMSSRADKLVPGVTERHPHTDARGRANARG